MHQHRMLQGQSLSPLANSPLPGACQYGGMYHHTDLWLAAEKCRKKWWPTIVHTGDKVPRTANIPLPLVRAHALLVSEFRQRGCGCAG